MQASLVLPRVTLKEVGLNNEGQSRKLSHEIMVIEDDMNLAELLKYELWTVVSMSAISKVVERHFKS